MEAVKEPLLLLEIEKELAGPDSHEGLPPDEYPKAEALREANTLARKILRLTARVGGEAQKA